VIGLIRVQIGAHQRNEVKRRRRERFNPATIKHPETFTSSVELIHVTKKVMEARSTSAGRDRPVRRKLMVSAAVMFGNTWAANQVRLAVSSPRFILTLLADSPEARREAASSEWTLNVTISLLIRPRKNNLHSEMADQGKVVSGLTGSEAKPGRCGVNQPHPCRNAGCQDERRAPSGKWRRSSMNCRRFITVFAEGDRRRTEREIIMVFVCAAHSK
ncbi:hypothetical protein GBF38_011981, partial [Nibea albiflora]